MIFTSFVGFEPQISTKMIQIDLDGNFRHKKYRPEVRNIFSKALHDQ